MAKLQGVPAHLQEWIDLARNELKKIGLAERRERGFFGYDIRRPNGGTRVFCHLRLGKIKHINFYGLSPQIGHLSGVHNFPGSSPILSKSKADEFRRELQPFVNQEKCADKPYYPTIEITELKDENKRKEIFSILKKWYDICHSELTNRPV